MTAVSVSFDGTRLNDAESAASPPWYDTGGGKAVLEPDLVYQNTYSVSEKVGIAQLGVGYYYATGLNMASPVRVAMLKCTISNLGVLNNEGSTGAIVDIGSNSFTSNYYSFYVRGKDTWSPSARWLFAFLDPNEPAYRDATNGAPILTAINWWAFKATFTGASKAENLAVDAVDWVAAGGGLSLVSGDGADADGTFQSFVIYDQGTLNNRYGVVFSLAGIVFCNLVLTIGSATATVFTSSNEQVVFPRQWLGVGAQGLKVDLQNASTAVTLSNDVFSSEGVDNLKRLFDTELQVDGVNDEVDITAHGYSTGQYVVYSKEGDAEAIGLTDGASYWVRAITIDAISFYSTRQAAMTGGTKVGLTPSSAGAGQNHSVRRTPQTTPVLTVSGTSGSMTASGCSFIRFSTVTSTSKPTWSGCTFVNPWSIVCGGSSISGCTVDGAMTVEGEPLMIGTVAQFEAVNNTEFIAGDYGGHGWRVDSGASPLDITGISWTGYGPDPGDGQGMAFDTETDVDGVNDEIDYVGHGFATGDPVYYSKYDPDDGSLGTESIGLTNGALLYVRAVTADSVSTHYTRYAAVTNANKIGLTASGAGNGEQHTLYSANAAVVNNTGAPLTINVTTGDSPSVRNSGPATTTVVNTVTVKVTVVDEGQNPVVGARVLVYDDAIPPGDTGGIVRKGTDGSGVASESYNYGGAITVRVVVRKKGYGYVEQTQPLGPGGLDLTVSLQADRIVE